MSETNQDLHETQNELQERAKSIAQDLYHYIKDKLPEGWEVEEPFGSPYCRHELDAGSAIVIRGRDTLIDARVEIQSSVEYKGKMEGWSFGFASTWEEGKIGPGSTIHNWTNKVWAMEASEREWRLKYLENHVKGFAKKLITEINEEG